MCYVRPFLQMIDKQIIPIQLGHTVILVLAITSKVSNSEHDEYRQREAMVMTMCHIEGN